MSTLIAIAVVEFAGKFLVGQRSPQQSLAGFWEFPGGKVLPGETPAAAARRECLEETGITIRVLEAYPAQLYSYAHDSVDLRFFRCTPELLFTVGWASSSPDEKAATPRSPFCWVSRFELAQLEFPAGNAAILRLLLGTCE